VLSTGAHSTLRHSSESDLFFEYTDFARCWGTSPARLLSEKKCFSLMYKNSTFKNFGQFMGFQKFSTYIYKKRKIRKRFFFFRIYRERKTVSVVFLVELFWRLFFIIMANYHLTNENPDFSQIVQLKCYESILGFPSVLEFRKFWFLWSSQQIRTQLLFIIYWQFQTYWLDYFTSFKNK